MPTERINIAPSAGTSRWGGGDVLSETLSDDRTLTFDELDTYPFIAFDPGGAGRTVTLPAEALCKGMVVFIANTANGAEVLTIEDDGSNTIVTPTQNETAILWCDGTSWHGLAGAES